MPLEIHSLYPCVYHFPMLLPTHVPGRRAISILITLLGLSSFYFLCSKFDDRVAGLYIGQDQLLVNHARLRQTYSYAVKSIPMKHWQKWNTNIANVEDHILTYIRSWRENNPYYRYELLSDESAETFVAASYIDRPEVIRTYLALKDNILRADLLRYMILFKEGGIYSDVDTEALKPISSWVPAIHKGKVNIVIGLEIDEPGSMWADWADNFAFCQSTMMASPGHRVYEIVIWEILRKLEHMAKEKKTDISRLQFTFHDVLRITGPTAFSDAVFQYLSETTGKPISRTAFSRISAPKRMADVLVMPTVAFVPGQLHSNSGSPDDSGALVRHYFMGSWRASHPLEQDMQT